MVNLKLETINSFEGFGNDKKIATGEYHRSMGMQKTKNGIRSAGVLQHLIDFYTLTDLGTATPNSIAYGRSRKSSDQTQADYLLCTGDSGRIIQSFLGFSSGSSGEYLHRALNNNTAYFMHGIFDQTGRFLYHQDRYLGMFDPNSATTNYITGTVTVTNGSTAVVGSGTTFIAGDVNKVFKVAGTNKFYRISAYTDATHITLASAYSGTTASGASFIINRAFDDSWKDFGASVSLPNGNVPKAPMDLYEDTVLFGRGNVITTLNVLTDTITTDGSPALNLPSGYAIEHIVSNSNGILIGGNTRSKGFCLLWDNFSDRSIAPWIWFEESVMSVCKDGSDWIVTTSKAIYRTNGYTTTLLADKFMGTDLGALFTSYPKNSIVIGEELYLSLYQQNWSRRRSGMYRFNLRTKLFEVSPRVTMNQVAGTFNQFEYSNVAYRLFVMVGGVTLENGVDYYSAEGSASCATYVSEAIGKGTNKKVAHAIRVKIKPNSPYSGYSKTFSFKISCKISDVKQIIYGRSKVKSTSASKNIITVNNGSSQWKTPNVGDEVEFAGDSVQNSNNNCGYSRNVISVTGAGTSSEVITVDSDFPDLPQIDQEMTVTPFQLIKRKTISTTTGELEEIYFDIKNKIKSNKFMVKIDIEANTSGIPIEVENYDVLYEDLGVI